MNKANALECALHLGAVIGIEEKEQTPRITAIRRDQTEMLTDSMNRPVQKMSVGNKNKPMVDETTTPGEECDAMETDIRSKFQEMEQELQPQDQKREKEMAIREGKTTMTYVDYVGKRVIGQRTVVIVLLVENLSTLSENALRIKGRNEPT